MVSSSSFLKTRLNLETAEKILHGHNIEENEKYLPYTQTFNHLFLYVSCIL